MLSRDRRKRIWTGSGAREEIYHKKRTRCPDWATYEGHTQSQNGGALKGNSAAFATQLMRLGESQDGDIERVRPQGHEMECCFESESDLHKKLIDCRKNPNHKIFVPLSEFGMQHLPEYWRDQLVVDFVRARADLTVRLLIQYTSPARPDGYVCADLRGTHFNRLGSGMVWRVSRRFSKKNGQTCPCEDCKRNPAEAKSQWGQFGIVTASHVIYDNTECRCTTADLFFDGPAMRGKCPKLTGVKIYLNQVEYDYCKITCVTHEEAVADRLARMVDRYEALHTRLENGYEKPGHGMVNVETCVIISHPHGMSKQVTVGDRFGRQPVPPHKWSYTTETCPGSSGAPVCLLRNKGWRRPFIISSAHSACNEKGENECGAGWAFIT